MTELQRFILTCLVEDLHVDPVDDRAGRLGIGTTARDIVSRADGYYGAPTIVRCLNAMSKPDPRHGDPERRRAAWVRQVGPEASVPQAGPGRQWVATADGAAQVQR